MKKFWNSLFFGTFSLLSYGGANLIQKPMFAVLSFIFPSLRKNSKEIKKSARSVMDNQKSGMNLGFAFSLMIFSTALIYGTICIVILNLIDYKVKGDLIYFLLIILACSYLTNFKFIYQRNRYQVFFDKFKTEEKSFFLSSILFHCLSMFSFISSLYLTGKLDNIIR